MDKFIVPEYAKKFGSFTPSKDMHSKKSKSVMPAEIGSVAPTESSSVMPAELDIDS